MFGLNQETDDAQAQTDGTAESDRSRQAVIIRAYGRHGSFSQSCLVSASLEADRAQELASTINRALGVDTQLSPPYEAVAEPASETDDRLPRFDDVCRDAKVQAAIACIVDAI